MIKIALRDPIQMNFKMVSDGKSWLDLIVKMVKSEKSDLFKANRKDPPFFISAELWDIRRNWLLIDSRSSVWSIFFTGL